MSNEYLVNRLSQTQRDFLIDHIDGDRPMGHVKNEDATRNALISSGLIAYSLYERVEFRPKGTRLTERGREIVCIILGQYADALVRCGCLTSAPPIKLPKHEREQMREIVANL